MSRCICGHLWDDHATWCDSSGCPCHFSPAPEASRAALLAELEAGVEGLPGLWLDAPYVTRAAVLDLIRKAGKL